jgi:hypothetical protein
MRMADDGEAERRRGGAIDRAFDPPGRTGDQLADRSRRHRGAPGA